MKESSHKLSKHKSEGHKLHKNKNNDSKDNGSHSKKHNGSFLSSSIVKHQNVLKERHGSRERNDKKHSHNNSQPSSHYKNDKGKSSEHKSSKSSDRKSNKSSSHHRKEDDRRCKGKNKAEEEEESYEELSRKKRKIESELHALDLEEAAEREAKNKKPTKRQSNENSRGKTKVPVKEEPVSDEDRRHKKAKNRSVKQEPVDAESSSNDAGRWGISHNENKKSEKPKEKPNFATSGKLAEDTNTFNGVVIKYNEPAEARKPRRRWRLYPFKGDTDLPFIPIHRQSAYLFGRTRKIADIPIDHPSCSKQHAVLQYRMVTYKRDDGTKGRRVRPYIIDLESSNGTFVNNKRVDARCYVELMEKDVVKFGYSTREYVLLHEESKNDEEDDEVMDSN